MKSANERPNIERLMIDVSQVADMLSCSTQSIRVWSSEGRMPRPCRIGRSIRWRLKEVRDWIAAGAPDLREKAKESQ